MLWAWLESHNVGRDAGKTIGLQDSPLIDGAENLMFLNIINVIYFQDQILHSDCIYLLPPDHFPLTLVFVYLYRDGYE